MVVVEIEKLKYTVNIDEFCDNNSRVEYNNLKMLYCLPEYERLISLLKELQLLYISDIVFCNPTHGGFVALKCENFVKNIHLLNVSDVHKQNIETNINNFKTLNIHISNEKKIIENIDENSKIIVFAENRNDINYEIINKYNPIVITQEDPNLSKKYLYRYKLSNSDLSIYMPNRCVSSFMTEFKYYLVDDILEYNNLINLCIMVKNGGPQFEHMLKENLKFIDRWTILDTGSTDNTIETINKVLANKKGNLYREPFINFRDSRNRLLELAGCSCTYIVMLDDTYILKGDLITFLTDVRGDQTSDSFSLYIKSDDVEYASNRVLKSNRKLKYINKIHEVIQDKNNMNIIIPITCALIDDTRHEYMEVRTQSRKQLDLKLLYEELEEDPDNSRTLYYLGQTYNLLQDYEKAYKYFIERMNHLNEGFIQEKIDAIFEAARLANFKLNKPWKECEELYLKAYSLDKSRPDSVYFIGIHYYLNNEKALAFSYFKKGYEIGYPVHCQYSLKPTLSFRYLPRYLTELCYTYNDYLIGEKAAELFLQHNTIRNDTPGDECYEMVLSWYNIFIQLNKMKINVELKVGNIDRPILCFVADGGFSSWSGVDIMTKGVGGSETYIIEMARYIQKQGLYKVIVFCKCETTSIFEDVDYIPINLFPSIATKLPIDTCIISRFSEYIPVAYKGTPKNVYLVLHDLTPSGCVIPIDNKLKKIFCLTEWHVGYFTNIYPVFKDITEPFYYGIDINKFDNNNVIVKQDYKTKSNINFEIIESVAKIKNKFIYSSFPNRGLLQLLEMWPAISMKYPDASLHIYSDIDGKWVNSVEKELMIKIRDLLDKYKNNQDIHNLNINYHGWVSKEVLANSWKTSEYWLYPCTFKETFCLTALEAALSKTLCITNGLAALENTVGNRGICINGDTNTVEWQTEATNALFTIMENKKEKERLVEMNYNWALNQSWENQADKLTKQYFLPHTKRK